MREMKPSQCFGCGTRTPAQMREQAASDNPAASPISLSENASSFGAISRLNQASFSPGRLAARRQAIEAAAIQTATR
jgi:hypothetical protein